MPVIVNEARSSFTISGAPFEPTDAAWRTASPEARTAFWHALGRAAEEAKDHELARGVGADGRRLKHRKHPRPDGATGPPLSPHQSLSRCRKWLRSKPGRDGVTLFWSHGWAQVVGYHHRGAGHLPVRDIVGLAPASQRRLEHQAAAIWSRLRPRRP